MFLPNSLLKLNYQSIHRGTCFGTCLYSVGTHHGNLLKSLVTMSRVTYFILWAHTNAVNKERKKEEEKKEAEDSDKTKLND